MLIHSLLLMRMHTCKVGNWQDSTLTGDGSCTLAAASADQISQLERQLPALNGNGPTVTLNGDTSKMIELQWLESLLHSSLSLFRLESANLQLPPYFAGMPAQTGYCS